MRDEIGRGSQSAKVCATIDTVEDFALPSWPSLLPGMKLDRYELVCPIGEGGMGQVWAARQTGKFGFERLVAVKTILPRFALEERCQAMFIDEVRVASRVEHANVAKILDVGEQESTTYLVMEYVEGEALSVLRDALRRKGVPIPTGILLHIMIGVCAGLQAAHELSDPQGQPLGVVHRDISPQNILVNTKGEAKLIDFGLAKARDRISGNTSEGTLKGKIRYMAPEQALGRTVDCRTDIWSIGAVMHDALAGRSLYDGENETQILHQMMSSGPVLRLPADVHPAVAAVLRRALAPEPTDRFTSSADMQQAIQDAMTEAEISVTSQTVATFVLEHVGRRVLARKEAIRNALQRSAVPAGLARHSMDSQAQATEIVDVQLAEKSASRRTGNLDRFTMSALSSEMGGTKIDDFGSRLRLNWIRGLAAVLVGIALLAGAITVAPGLFVHAAASSTLAMPVPEGRAPSRVLLDRDAGQRVSPYIQPGLLGRTFLTEGGAGVSPEAGGAKAPPPPRAVRPAPTSKKRQAAPKAIIDDGF